MPPEPGATDVGRPSSRADEVRHHRESTASVRLKAQRLRRALDSDRLDDAIKIAADVAAELRSSSAAELSPKAYYDVYLSVCAELRLLEMYVMESARRGAPVLELYERVQETPLVLPRLYLLITAGSVYVKSLQAPAKDVLRDLVEMCAGVQHPQRGLFLRAYLAQMMKDKLPDAQNVFRQDFVSPTPSKANIDASLDTSDYDGSPDDSGGTVQDSIDFVIRNFTEMNRLWVRMQHDCAPRLIEFREKERLELRLLVGSNIATLSRLVGVDLAMYKDTVLPAILSQIVSCNDAIAQEYLADCVAQVFPDDFQLATLDAFMVMCEQIVRGVNLRTILVSMIERLRRYAGASTECAQATQNARAFEVFQRHLPAVVERQGSSLCLADRLHIHLSLMAFALEAESDRPEFVDAVLGFVADDVRSLSSLPSNGNEVTSDGASRPRSASHNSYHTPVILALEEEQLIEKLLTMPLDSYQSVGAALQLNNFIVVQRFLRYSVQRSLGAKLLRSTSEYVPCISDVSTLEKLFEYVSSLVQDSDQSWLSNADTKGTNSTGEAGSGWFDTSSLSSHHEYLLSLVPVSHSSTALTRQDPSAVVNEQQSAKSSGATPLCDDDENEDFQENQELVSRIVFLCQLTDIHGALSLYTALRQQLMRGGPKRTAITLPPLILAGLRLVRRCREEEDVSDAVDRALTFAVETASALPESSALLTLRLRLHIAITASAVGDVGKRFVYDSFAAAYLLFELYVSTANDQFAALELIVVALGHTRASWDVESYDALAMRAVKHASSLLTRSDQCLMLCLCSRMFLLPRSTKTLESDSVSENEQDYALLSSRAVECIKRASTVAMACLDTGERALLFLDVISHAIGLKDLGCDAVDEAGTIETLLRGLRELLSNRNTKSAPIAKLVLARHGRLTAYIRAHPKRFGVLDSKVL